jgi:hypothetical protein
MGSVVAAGYGGTGSYYIHCTEYAVLVLVLRKMNNNQISLPASKPAHHPPQSFALVVS